MRIRLLWRERVLIGLLVGSGVLLALLSDVFFTPANLLRATRYAAEIGLVALPMTMIIISRGIDLSVASNMALSAMTMGLLWQRGIPVAGRHSGHRRRDAGGVAERLGHRAGARPGHCGDPRYAGCVPRSRHRTLRRHRHLGVS